MNGKTLEAYRPELDPKMMRYWMRQGPKAAAFLLVIPGCALIGYGIGMLLRNALPCSVIGFGGGLLLWGMIVALGR
ncbi:MAG TPA: hypothetical protein VNZ56_08470 [Verrucomicrobiae bacterium]|jgi:hypothetical protein|nr:hypothetical protein [Verrucomicrobiae bacterium]